MDIYGIIPILEIYATKGTDHTVQDCVMFT